MSTPTEYLRKFRGSTSPGATHRVVFGRSCKDLADRSLVLALRPPRRHESAWSAATFYGIGSAVARIVDVARVTIDENVIPIGPVVRVACELLALDPLYVANEGRFVAFVPAREAERTMNLLRRHDVSRNAVVAGHVTSDDPGRVLLRSRIGGIRVLDMLSGEQLPRIC